MSWLCSNISKTRMLYARSTAKCWRNVWFITRLLVTTLNRQWSRNWSRLAATNTQWNCNECFRYVISKRRIENLFYFNNFPSSTSFCNRRILEHRRRWTSATETIWRVWISYRIWTSVFKYCLVDLGHSIKVIVFHCHQRFVKILNSIHHHQWLWKKNI